MMCLLVPRCREEPFLASRSVLAAAECSCTVDLYQSPTLSSHFVNMDVEPSSPRGLTSCWASSCEAVSRKMENTQVLKSRRQTTSGFRDLITSHQKHSSRTLNSDRSPPTGPRRLIGLFNRRPHRRRRAFGSSSPGDVTIFPSVDQTRVEADATHLLSNLLNVAEVLRETVAKTRRRFFRKSGASLPHISVFMVYGNYCRQIPLNANEVHISFHRLCSLSLFLTPRPKLLEPLCQSYSQRFP